ncbi:putative galactose/methyl galactoside ABC transporter, ATP-binding protein MglA [[Clostridium] asparagiforme DSM 15981]|uniref:Ribose/galactose/methyl galactoside import ATP-binding protein n=1 Tax=[Clostridium] asparagiforme DSM 15981 TaxID=518636 RepID=C0D197_9FIRM|nr:putative galactose/methyl galactoside ABC transporter, ATP-binding protein MglA [[Clostridium] asparagiforme DSM 15981]
MKGDNGMAEYRLEMRGVSKSFPGVKALDGISLKVRPGSVHALMGENGAGKSTLMKCLFGIYKMDEGEVYLDGKR